MSDQNRVKIISARDRNEVDPAGKLKTLSLYEYTIGDLGPFVFKVPAENDTPEALKAAIDAKKAIIATQE